MLLLRISTHLVGSLHEMQFFECMRFTLKASFRDKSHTFKKQQALPVAGEIKQSKLTCRSHAIRSIAQEFLVPLFAKSGSSRRLLRSGRAESSVSAISIGEGVGRLPIDTHKLGHDELSDAFAGFEFELGVGYVGQDHFDFSAVIGIDGAGCIEAG